MTLLAAVSAPHEVSCCRVIANGVPSEWVETAVATDGQPTFVYFLSGGYGEDALERSRAAAGRLAFTTGARVLTVACSSRSDVSPAAAVEAGIAAYDWLLGEGCDVDWTTFTHDDAGASLARAILTEARDQGLPIPAGGIRSASPAPVSALPPSRSQPTIKLKSARLSRG